ncbi:MAG: Beta-lactamase hydrolase-like protein [Pseudomonadota bacterium]|jgi:uncharacterized protein (TIGR01244 family)
MPDFRQVTDSFWASPQIDVADLHEAARLGCTLVINNRPEGESDDQTDGSTIEQEARKLGMNYLAIPVTHAGFSEPQVDALVQALENNAGRVLAYCRSGTRSTLLWSLAQARLGRKPDAIAEAAAGAGYDVTPISALLDMFAASKPA